MAAVPMSLADILKAIQLGQAAVALVRGLVAAYKSAHPGEPVPDDATLIRILADNSDAGEAEAAAVVANLRAQL